MEAKDFKVGMMLNNGRVVKKVTSSYFTDTNGMSTLFRDAKGISESKDFELKKKK